MALQKTIETPQGVDCNYHVIYSVMYVQHTSKINVEMASYPTSAQFGNGKPPVSRQSYPMDFDKETVIGGTMGDFIEDALIANVADFSGATKVE